LDKSEQVCISSTGDFHYADAEWYLDDAEAAAALSTAIQDFIITLEMIPIALYHRYAFPVSEIPMMSDMPLPSLFSAMKDSMGFSDVIRDGFTTLRGDWLGPESMIAFNNRGIVPARSQSSLPKLSSRVYRYGTTSNTTQPIQLPVDEAASMSTPIVIPGPQLSNQLE